MRNIQTVVAKWRSSQQVDKIKRYHGFFSLVMVLTATVVFLWRNSAGITVPNFYAEDATVFFNNIYTKNPLQAILTPFNGYLVVGQYFVGYLAVAINLLFGNDIIDLALITFFVSATFLGFVSALPYVLFRRDLGTWLALLLVLLTALVPMYGFDYAIIGTIGNLKFAFLYIAFLLLVYRYVRASMLKTWQFICIDAVLLLCVLTNVTVALLVPLVLWLYLSWILKFVQRSKVLVSAPMISAFILVLISMVYVILALYRGIPDMPGYLDGPFKKQAILPIIERSTAYALTYPLTATFTNVLVGLLLCVGLALLGYILWRYRDKRYVLIAAVWAITIGTGLFVLNRPGVSDFYLNYAHKGGPDQFFYAQNMIFIFALGWLVKDKLSDVSRRQLGILTVLVGLYLVWALPFGSSFGRSAVVYEYIKPIKPNIEQSCRKYADQRLVVVQVYPSPYWQWQVDKKLACNY
jgi:hypothetical protein